MMQTRSEAVPAAACTTPGNDAQHRPPLEGPDAGVMPADTGIPSDTSDSASYWKAGLLQALGGMPATMADVDARLTAVFPALPAEFLPQSLSPFLAAQATTANCYVRTRVELAYLTAFLQVLLRALTSGMGEAICLVSPLSMLANRFVVPAMQALLADALGHPQGAARLSGRTKDGEHLLCLSLAAENALESLLLRMTRALRIAPPRRGGQGDRRQECEERILGALAERKIVGLVISGIAQRHLGRHSLSLPRMLEEVRRQGVVVSLLTTPAIDQLPEAWLAELAGVRFFRNSRYAIDELEFVVDRQRAAISATAPAPTGMTEAARAAYGQREWIQALFMAMLEINDNGDDPSPVSSEAVFDHALCAWAPQMRQWQRLCRQGREARAEQHEWADWVPWNFMMTG
ncbi:hypothetical protein [Cupriavidus basilensis]|uniref:hypothetical protein n=1 Tax=Cupriavidus basilensis TaxID=68895 RepID=UPI00157ACF85|nr:hypothetical protein [Cupriavidus basilensis]NUA30264.1 hypothetical protein [Cupriavidus basilensis]